MSKLRKALKFLSGKGIEAKPGALGMSLQTPRGLTDADVTLLREAAGGAPADAAPAPVAVKAPPVQEASAVDEEEDKAPAPEPAVPAATARDDSPALLAAWRKNPCAELAEALQARLRATTPAAQPASEKEWLRRAKAPAELSELAMLLSEIRGPTMADIYRRADALALLMPDPRIAQALADFAGNVPFTSDSSTNMWSRVFRALEKSGDPRLLSWIPQVRSALGVRPTFKKYFEASLASLEDVLKAQFPSGIPAPSAPSAALLASLPAVVAKPKSSVPGRDELFAEVYANPIDDGPRLVLADLLQEQGDPRGEFIALQCHQPGSKRERELLKEHGKAWLGELAPWVGADFEFRRGFPSAVSIKLKNENEMKKTRDLRAWSTIEILTMGKAGPTGETFAQAVPRTLGAIGELRGLFDQGVEWLLAHGTSYRPTRLEFRALRQRELWERLVGSGVCEKLTDVEGINLDWVVSSPLVGQLAEIRVEALLADEHLETVLRHPHLKLHFGNQDHAGTVAMRTASSPSPSTSL